jgi:hypothetical protein
MAVRSALLRLEWNSPSVLSIRFSTARRESGVHILICSAGYTEPTDDAGEKRIRPQYFKFAARSAAPLGAFPSIPAVRRLLSRFLAQSIFALLCLALHARLGSARPGFVHRSLLRRSVVDARQRSNACLTEYVISRRSVAARVAFSQTAAPALRYTVCGRSRRKPTQTCRTQHATCHHTTGAEAVVGLDENPHASDVGYA